MAATFGLVLDCERDVCHHPIEVSLAGDRDQDRPVQRFQRAQAGDAPPPVLLAQGKPSYDCLIGEKIWRDRSWMFDSR